MIFLVTLVVSTVVAAVVGFGTSRLGDLIADRISGNDGWEDLAELGGADQKRVVVKEDSAVIEAVEKVKPTVVNIVVTKDLNQYYEEYGNSLGNGLFDFFGGFDWNRSNTNGQSEPLEIGGGTGFVISAEGLILTNRHVVEDDTADYTVVTAEGDQLPAKVLARDSLNDIAVVKVEKTMPAVAELGDSDALEAGQTVIAIGNSMGEYANSVTKGVVSGVGRAISAGNGYGEAEDLENVIQTDAAINPGNSGGPLINIDGQVIGINTAIDVSGQLLGFAIPINDAKSAVDSVKKTGRISRPWIGVRYVMVDSEIAKKNDLPVDYGALVVRGSSREELAVVPGSPANKAGIVENDIILEFEGTKIDADHTLSDLILKKKVGDRVELKIWHQGEEKTVKLILTERN